MWTMGENLKKKSINNFLSYAVHKLTNRQMPMITSPPLAEVNMLNLTYLKKQCGGRVLDILYLIGDTDVISGKKQ